MMIGIGLRLTFVAQLTDLIDAPFAVVKVTRHYYFQLALTGKIMQMPL